MNVSIGRSSSKTTMTNRLIFVQKSAEPR